METCRRLRRLFSLLEQQMCTPGVNSTKVCSADIERQSSGTRSKRRKLDDETNRSSRTIISSRGLPPSIVAESDFSFLELSRPWNSSVSALVLRRFSELAVTSASDVWPPVPEVSC